MTLELEEFLSIGKTAERAGIKQVVQNDVKGVGDSGALPGYLGYAESVKIGDFEFHDCYVEVVEKRSVLGDDGIIGANVFSDFLVDLDFPHWKLNLSPLPRRADEAVAEASLDSPVSARRTFHDRYVAPEMKLFTPVFRFGPHLLVPTRVNNLPLKLFLIDTGAFSNIISPAAAREVTKVSADSDYKVKGLSGTVKEVFRADELTLQFGHFKQKNLDIVAFSTKTLSDASGMEVSGILGFALLGRLRVKIDYRDGLVDFIYDPTRSPQ